MVRIEDIRLTPKEVASARWESIKWWKDPPLHSNDSQYDELRHQIQDSIANTATDKAIRKIVEWGIKDCPHLEPLQEKHDCGICWEELKKLIEGEK